MILIFPYIYTFSGTDSSDPEGGILTYHWELNSVSGSGEDIVQESLNPNFTVSFPSSGIYIISLQVIDNGCGLATSATDYLEVTVSDESLCAARFSDPTVEIPVTPPVSYCESTSFNRVDNQFTNTCCSCLPGLQVQNEKTYLASVWVANESSLECGQIDPIGFYINIATEGANSESVNFTPSGPIIEGWQRYEAEIYIPAGTQSLDINFNNSHSGVPFYFDDFRFHPFKSNMRSYVYDSSSLRLSATLDENNYATFYEYDDEGLLVRVKRETEKGIMTVQESRTVLQPNN